MEIVQPLISSLPIMARYFRLFLLILVSSLLSACQNGEDMGRLYGMWQLESIQIAQEETLHPSNLFLSFQSEVVEAKEVSQASHGYVSLFGTAHHEGDALTMHFTEVDTTVVTCDYLLGQRFRFPEQDPLILQVRVLNGSHLTLHDGEREWRFIKN